jgi:hypothetical protein
MTQWLYKLLRRLADSRPPDFVIGADYCRRWWVIPRNRWFNIYLHQFLHSDDDRALHDHPWWNMSWLLAGQYWEWTTVGKAPCRQSSECLLRSAGNKVYRRAEKPHRIELVSSECWSLFITGPVVREWGFHCPNGWRPWHEFVKADSPGQIGRGCD